MIDTLYFLYDCCAEVLIFSEHPVGIRRRWRQVASTCWMMLGRFYSRRHLEGRIIMGFPGVNVPRSSIFEISSEWDLVVRVDLGDDSDDEHVARLTRRLRLELLELDFDAVEPIAGAAAEAGAKAAGGILGSLGLRLGAATFKAAIARIRDWASRNECCVEVTLDGDTIKITRATDIQRDKLIEAWLARHSGAC